MSRKMTVVVVAVVLVATAGVAAVWALNGRQEQVEEHTVGSDSHVEIDPFADDPVLVAEAVMQAGMTWYPAEDGSSLDGFLRVGSRLTDSWRAELEQAAGKEMGTKAMPKSWYQWAAGGDETFAVAHTVRSEVDQDAGGLVVVDVDQRVLHRDGETTPYSRYQAEVSVVSEDGQWLVDGYEVVSVEY